MSILVPILVVNLTGKELFAKEVPSDEIVAKAYYRYQGKQLEFGPDNGFVQVRNFTYYSETNATSRFLIDLGNIEDKAGFTEYVASGMAVFRENEEAKAQMDIIFGEIVEAGYGESHQPLFPKTDSTINILVLYRDTGTAEDGVYPELDSGGAISDIVEVISNTPPSNGIKMQALLVGNSKDLGAPSIKQYFKLLGENNKLTALKESARDVETYFMKWAYDNKMFSMVVGFRSGLLDSFTFLGIPTLSIGLKYMVGEERHSSLATSFFKRFNMNYDQPRHLYTAWIKKKFQGDRSPPDPVILASPFVPGQSPEGVQPRTDVFERGVAAVGFHPFDKIVFHVAFRVAIEKEMEWVATMVNWGEERRVIDSSVARSYYPRGTRMEDLVVYFAFLRLNDEQQIKARKDEKLSLQLQENDLIRQRYWNSSAAAWRAIEQALHTEYSDYDLALI
jgi:hypothetical protein